MRQRRNGRTAHLTVSALRLIQLRPFTIVLVHLSILVNVIIHAAWVVVKWEINAGWRPQSLFAWRFGGRRRQE